MQKYEKYLVSSKKTNCILLKKCVLKQSFVFKENLNYIFQFEVANRA